MRALAWSVSFIIAVGAACGGSTTPGSDASTDGSIGDSTTADGSACMEGRTLCSGKCVNVQNDPQNCGSCGTKCTGATPYCEGTCKPNPCFDGGACPNGFCCGSTCCVVGQICCRDQGPVEGPPQCHTPTMENPTCPQGCAPLCKSDRNIKQNIVPVDSRAVLETLSTVPVSTWSYKDDPKTTHMGPMAQDLHAAFGLGSTDKAYNPIDAHGIEMASIQALHDLLKEQSARIDKLEKQNAELLDRCSRRQ